MCNVPFVTYGRFLSQSFQNLLHLQHEMSDEFLKHFAAGANGNGANLTLSTRRALGYFNFYVRVVIFLLFCFLCDGKCRIRTLHLSLDPVPHHTQKWGKGQCLRSADVFLRSKFLEAVVRFHVLDYQVEDVQETVVCELQYVRVVVQVLVIL